MRCSAGHENPEGNAFCGKCGEKLKAAPVAINDYFHDRRQPPEAGESVRSVLQSRPPIAAPVPLESTQSAPPAHTPQQSAEKSPAEIVAPSAKSAPPARSISDPD